MKIIFYSELQFETWDWTNPDTKGIGGSETSHIEMAWRLAARGHEVISYAPVPWEGQEVGNVRWDRNVKWMHYSHANFEEKALWIIYRTPAIMDKFGPIDAEQPRWLICQDVTYADFNTERIAKFDKIVTLCGDHSAYISGVEGTAGKIWQSSNGIKAAAMRAVERGTTSTRNPKKLIYASSPDRGLLTLLKIFKKARDLDNELELHVFYGFDNIDKLTKGDAPWKDEMLRMRGRLEKHFEQPGVFWRGRVGQQELWAEYLSAGIWCYPSEFTETSCITSMEAQALGCIPITNPIWGVKENVQWGISIEGRPYTDALVRDRYTAEIIRLARNPDLQERWRYAMMEFARMLFTWERMVNQWECAVLGYPNAEHLSTQFSFHFKHSTGRVLNVGSSFDSAGFGARGAVNMDVTPIDPVVRTPTSFHVLHDARLPFPENIGKFDTVILSEILEHIPHDDWSSVLLNAKDALNPGGQILISIPLDDTRSRNDQARWVEDQQLRREALENEPEYAPGCPAYHRWTYHEDDLLSVVAECGLDVDVQQVLDYGFFGGLALRLVEPRKEIAQYDSEAQHHRHRRLHGWAASDARSLHVGVGPAHPVHE